MVEYEKRLLEKIADSKKEKKAPAASEGGADHDESASQFQKIVKI